MKFKTLIKIVKNYARENNKNYEDLKVVILTKDKCGQLTKRDVVFDEDSIIITDQDETK